MAVTIEADSDDRQLDERAATEFLSVLTGVGRARDDGLYLVVSQSGKEYVVDPDRPECTCPDHEHRGRRCKHIRRTRFALGWRPIPHYIDVADVDEQLGIHVDDGQEDDGR